MWITPVENPVDNVEKSSFSTAIFSLLNKARFPASMHIPLHICPRLPVSCVLCCHRNYPLIFPDFIKKVGILCNSV
jgi:hypothetical protein